jgi:hypothetical protein
MEAAVFFRKKVTKGYTYLHLVENRREGGRTRQRQLASLGRLDELQARGSLDELLRSGGKFAQSAAVIAGARNGELEQVRSQRIGAAIVFDRLWRETGCQGVIQALLADRAFSAPIERAVFATVLHRLVAPGSDRACEHWLRDEGVAGCDGLQLHHLYRAMAWLGESLEIDDGERTVRSTKDVVEERLFDRRRNLFNDLELVLLDTTSLYFHGAGGAELGARGHSKDRRPELKQLILAIVVDQRGRPICSETWPGNTADVNVLLPIVRRLRERFCIARVCVVADRGMVSSATIAELERQEIGYILGTRERRDKEVRNAVLTDERGFVPLSLPRVGHESTDIEVKDVRVDDRRYVVCRNPEQAEHDAEAREAMLASLRDKLRQGDKTLVGNSGYRRFLRTVGEDHFEIDDERVAAEATFDGISVLRTNTDLPATEVARQYRQLWLVEQIFRTTKAILRTRPIYHQSESAIRGHVFCSFLALVLRKDLEERLADAGVTAEWPAILRDLEAIHETEVRDGEQHVVLRDHAQGCAGQICKAVGVALPPLFRNLGKEGRTPATA